MKLISRAFLIALLLTLTFSIAYKTNSYAGGSGQAFPLAETDTNNYQLFSFFDLRERESFVQVTIPDAASILHVQVFDVSNLCNENNFFDSYTANDTHVYNLRNLTTNDTNPAGFVLPDGAYGFVVVTAVLGIGQPANTEANIIGNFRVLDNTGYEYRTNSQGPSPINTRAQQENFTFNFNSIGNVGWSDVIGITVNNIQSGEVTATGSSITFDTTLFNNNEVEFSCSDTTFSCTSDTFEYGINDALPSSRDGGVTCGSNVIPEGLVHFNLITTSDIDAFAGYIGLNNGNGRGSMDSFHQDRGQLNCQDRGFCRVFVTSTEQNGNLGGVAGANEICQSLADASSFTQGGKYLAWISDSLGNSPDVNFNKVNVPYQRVNGTIVANDYADLIDCTNPDCLVNNISLNENNEITGTDFVWTSTNDDGTPFMPNNCENWTNDGSNMNPPGGRFGNKFNTNNMWTSTGTDECNLTNHLYCFEQ